MSLMVSISGIRGVIGESLTPESIIKYAAAFAEYCDRGRIVIGRDGRITGSIVANLVSSTLLSMGCDVVAIGIVPTPTVQIAVEELHAAGGIAITASHNPMQWNGLKFMSSTGMFLNAEENARFWAIAERSKPKYVAWDAIGKHRADDTFLQKHIDAVLRLPFVEIETIKARKLRVVLDCVNAAGGRIVPQMLRSLGCTVIELCCDVSGVFQHTPEPIPENLTDLAAAVVREKADIGIAVDPDVDRLVLISETGEPFGEEYTITSVIDYVLKRIGATARGSSVVVNLSTTRAVEDVAARYGAHVVRTPVGEINVASRMKSIGAVAGGEGSGGVILPDVHLGRDAIVGIAIVLQSLAERGGKVSELRASLPAYQMVKAKIPLTGKSPDVILVAIQRMDLHAVDVNTEDGLRIAFDHSWVHLRKSNTEPLIRIIGEAPTREEAAALVERFTRLILDISAT